MERRCTAMSLAGAVAISLTVAGARPAGAHVGDLVFPIYELPSSDLPDLHDGSVEDWEEVLPGVSLDHRDFHAVYIDGEQGGYVDQGVIAFDIYLAWHYASQRIFVGVRRYDAVYTFRLPREPPPVQMKLMEFGDEDCCWEHDHVDVVVDGDHGGEACADNWNPRAAQFEKARRVSNRECQRYTAVPEAEGDRRIRAFTIGPVWAFDPPYTDAGGYRFGESPSLSGYEIAVTPWDELQDDPASSVRSRLEPENVVGLCIGIWDIDEIEWPKFAGELAVPVSLYTSSGCDPFDNTNSADAQLIPCTMGDCSQGPSSASSLVRMDSWGRIKASFR